MLRGSPRRREEEQPVLIQGVKSGCLVVFHVVVFCTSSGCSVNGPEYYLRMSLVLNLFEEGGEREEEGRRKGGGREEEGRRVSEGGRRED